MNALKTYRNVIPQLDAKIRGYVESAIVNNTVGTGKAFCDWCLYYLFELNEEERIEAMKYSGCNDNSIDALFEINDRLYILQTKYGFSHKWDGVTKFVEDIKRLVHNQPTGGRQELFEAVANINDHINEEKEIKLFYITNNELTDFEQIKIKELKNSGELQKLYYNFNLDILGLTEIQTFLEDKFNSVPLKFQGVKLNLCICSDAIEADNTIVSQVLLKDFASFVQKGEDYLYYSNIRNYLKKTAVNKGIEDTLKNDPGNFWYYNNGVTIVCDDMVPNNRVITLTTPQIVNGCQTGNTIKLYFKKLTKEQRDKVPGKLLVKIIKDPKGEKRNNITKYTNSQNAIRGKDFYALDTFQKDLQSKFKETGYYYEIQAGSRFLKEVDKSKYQGQSMYSYLTPKNYDNIIIAKDNIQSYTAGIKQLPGMAYGKPSELTPTSISDSWKEIILADAPYTIEYYLFPYLVLKYAKSYLDYNSNSKDFKRSAGLLFVTTYFKTLIQILIKAKYFDIYEDNPLKIPVSILTKTFSNEKINSQILKMVDNILKDYFGEIQL